MWDGTWAATSLSGLSGSGGSCGSPQLPHPGLFPGETWGEESSKPLMAGTDGVGSHRVRGGRQEVGSLP